nr:unnamed protein product [Callosobruchus analis]
MLKQSPIIDELCMHDIKKTNQALELNNIDTNCRAFLALGTEPLNSIVPLCCEALKKFGNYNPSTVFGITALDTVRANTIVAKMLKIEPEKVMVPVIGGYSEETRVPVLSQVRPSTQFSNEQIEQITMSIRKPKQKTPSGLLAAFAIARFVISLVKGIRGHKDVFECAYVPSKVIVVHRPV